MQQKKGEIRSVYIRRQATQTYAGVGYSSRTHRLICWKWIIRFRCQSYRTLDGPQSRCGCERWTYTPVRLPRM